MKRITTHWVGSSMAYYVESRTGRHLFSSLMRRTEITRDIMWRSFIDPREALRWTILKRIQR